MLTDPREVEIIAKARQKNVRDHERSRKHFEHIFADFFKSQSLTGQCVLDLGPGQYDFGVLALERGGHTVGIDNDPAVIELGNYKGFEAVYGRIQEMTPEAFGRTFDGLFCKFSINCFWYDDDPEAQDALVDRAVGLMKPDAWGWVAPWNGVPKKAELKQDEVDSVLDRQIARFRHYGFRAFDLNTELATRYGITGAVANHALFVRGLNVPKGVERYESS